MTNHIIKKEEFRWSFRKKGTQVLNICTHLLFLYGFATALMMGTSTAAFANPTGGVVARVPSTASVATITGCLDRRPTVASAAILFPASIPSLHQNVT